MVRGKAWSLEERYSRWGTVAGGGTARLEATHGRQGQGTVGGKARSLTAGGTEPLSIIKEAGNPI